MQKTTNKSGSSDEQNGAVRLWLIGCGTPTPTPDRFGSCFVLRVGPERLMFDCGPAATYKLRQAGMAPTDIHHLFFTHYHYDHHADYPCFLLCRWDHERGDVPRLSIHGPPPLSRITRKLIGPEGAFADDWRVRVGHPASRELYAARGGKGPRPEPRFDVREIAAGDRIEAVSAVVTAGTAVHLQPMMDCLAYRVDWDGGAVVFTGDTGRHESLETLAQGANTLVVNVWDRQENLSPAFTSGFCGTLDAAGMAAAAGAGRLVIAHQTAGLADPQSREQAMAEMAGVFEGEILFGEEFMALDLD